MRHYMQLGSSPVSQGITALYRCGTLIAHAHITHITYAHMYCCPFKYNIRMVLILIKRSKGVITILRVCACDARARLSEGGGQCVDDIPREPLMSRGSAGHLKFLIKLTTKLLTFISESDIFQPLPSSPVYEMGSREEGSSLLDGR